MSCPLKSLIEGRTLAQRLPSMLSLSGYVLADPRLERVSLPMIRPLAPFTVRPIRQTNVRRTVSAATISEAAAIESSITPSRRAINRRRWSCRLKCASSDAARSWSEAHAADREFTAGMREFAGPERGKIS